MRKGCFGKDAAISLEIGEGAMHIARDEESMELVAGYGFVDRGRGGFSAKQRGHAGAAAVRRAGFRAAIRLGAAKWLRRALAEIQRDPATDEPVFAARFF